MKKLLNIGIPLLAAGLLAALFVLAAVYGSENYNSSAQEQQTSAEGYYIHDMETGETRFVPYSQTDTYSGETGGTSRGTAAYSSEDSGETGGFSQGYDPFSNEKIPYN